MEISKRELQDEEVIAYHGGPHSFDKFSTQYMGTGEGANTFGWGLYFTDLEDIARDYANKLSDVIIQNLSIGNFTIIKDNRYVGYDIAKTETETRIVEHFAVHDQDIKNDYKKGLDLNKVVLLLLQEFIDEEKQELKYASSKFSTKDNDVIYYKNSIREAESLKRKPIKINITSNRNLYKVSLHKGKTPEQYTWLEWYKPVPEKVMNILGKKLIHNGKFLEDLFDNSREYEKTDGTKVKGLYPDGLMFYKRISQILGSDKEASLFLLKNGIDGIKYPADSLSRGATSYNTSGFNYVVFDENAVNIEKQTQLEGMEISKKDLIQNKKLQEDAEDVNFMFEVSKGELEEEKKKKADRCLKIARRKMPQTSAYRSGLIVQCRRGKIWKGLKEEDEYGMSGVKQLQNKLLDKYKGLKTLFLFNNKGVLSVDMIEVNPNERKKGVGSNVMNDIIEYADANNMEIRLNPAIKDERKGTTSRNRLVRFYKSFGFIENTGRNIDYTKKSGSMYRLPKSVQQLKEEEGDVDEKMGSRKQKQLDIINKTNPAPNDQNTWIRNIEDILSPEEAFIDDDNFIGTPDFRIKDAKEALKNGEIIVYSSYPIKNGIFVTPSKMEATLYAGYKTPYSKKVKLTDVAWIDSNEGQYAEVNAAEQLDEKTDFSKEKEQGLHGWFARQGGKGKSKGWVDCNTCRDGKCKSCGRKEGEKRSKYPACRPTPSACKTKGKGKSWGKKSANEDVSYEQSKQDIERELKLNEIKNTFKRLLK